MGRKAPSRVRIPPSPLARSGPGTTARLSASAPVAQLDRASVYGTEGHRFESCRARRETRMSAGIFADLTFGLEGRRSNRMDRGFKRFSVAVGRRFDFLATLLATSAMAGLPPLMGSRSSTNPSLRPVTSALVSRRAPGSAGVVGDEMAGRACGGVEGVVPRCAQDKLSRIRAVEHAAKLMSVSA